MSPRELTHGMRWLTSALYSDETTQRRRKPFFEKFRSRHHSPLLSA
jgi:hypothetical protein